MENNDDRKYSRANKNGMMFLVDETKEGQAFVVLGRTDREIKPAFEIEDKDRYGFARAMAGDKYTLVSVHDEHAWKADGSCMVYGCEATQDYPFTNGDGTVILGPDVIASTPDSGDDMVISWRGEDYVRQQSSPPRELLTDPAKQARIGDVVEIIDDDDRWFIRGEVIEVFPNRAAYPLVVHTETLTNNQTVPKLTHAHTYLISTARDHEFEELMTAYREARDDALDNNDVVDTDLLVRSLMRRNVRIVDSDG